MAHDTDARHHRPPAPPAPTNNPTLQIDERGIGWLTLDDPERKVNVLTEAVMRRLSELIAEAKRLAGARQIRALVFWSGKPESFVAGADVDAIAKVTDRAAGTAASRLGQQI